jgi:D-glycero-D-manno-heptose 1,7-bisphosphate phosphatase
MVVKATQDHHIEVSRSFLIGDKESDVECAHNAGVRAIRVRTRIQRDMTGSNAEWVVDDIPAAVQLILNTKS